MDETNWYAKAWRDGLKFSGRSRRREYAWFNLVNFLFLLPLIPAFSSSRADAYQVLAVLVTLVLVVPSLALNFRRLHDLGVSGWWFLVAFIPFGNLAMTLVLLFKNGRSGPNRYGPDPKAPDEGLVEVF